jgi:hypothetical protein
MTEQEKFYANLNEVERRNHTTLVLAEAVAKYKFWKYICTSKPGQFAILLALCAVVWIITGIAGLFK